MTEKYYLPADDLDSLVQQISGFGYRVFGPRVRDGVIVYDEIGGGADLTRGWKDEQSGGRYRLSKTGDASWFSYTVGPGSWKRFIFSPREEIFRAAIVDDEIRFHEPVIDSEKRAFFGIRSCELNAIAIQDRVLMHDTYRDNHYARRRDNLLFIAVNCTRSAETCFCASLNTGPRALENFDLGLTEVIDDENHYFCVETGSERGRQIIEPMSLDEIDTERLLAADRACAAAAVQQRSVDVSKTRDLTYANLDNVAFWQQLEDRCLSCGNCTQVCPTCFCSNVLEETSLDRSETKRIRQWDSCFNFSHSHLAGDISVRSSGASRYRQWFTHKMASWHDQFGTLGCTGCGRCITWCPVGIDITEESNRLQSIAGFEVAS